MHKTAVKTGKRPHVIRTIIFDTVNGKVKSSVLMNKLVNTTGLSISFLAENVFEVTPKTLSRYKNEDVRLPALLTEHAVKFYEMYNLGLELFGENAVFNDWLMKKNIGLGFKKPVDLLNISTGIDGVFEELKRIEFGATA